MPCFVPVPISGYSVGMRIRMSRPAGGLPGPVFESESGYTLFEMAAVLVIAGLIIGAAAAVALPVLKEARLVGTQAKMDNIAKAIDYYAVKNNRVPCPANPNAASANPPFGFERGSGANGDTVPATCGVAANRFGVVPFRTLGIPADWVRDAWGNYMTYAVSPAFSQDTTVDFPVHARCRTADWYTSPITYEPTVPSLPQYVHKSPAKARFCCPYPPTYPPATDIVVNDVGGNSQLAVTRASGLADPLSTASTTVPYRLNAGVLMENIYVANNDRPTAPVYILVSHGPDGYGAYNVDNGGARNPVVGTPATSDEITNASDTGTFYEIPKLNRSGLQQGFDDIVLWRTQDLIFAEQGQTCAIP